MRGPWQFDNHLIVFEKPKGAREISNLAFDKVEIWVQVHNLPLMCMNRSVARLIAEEIGQVIEIPADAKECRGTDWVKPKPQRPIVKGSSEKGGSKSNSTSDGSTKGVEASRRDQPQSQSNEISNSGGSVGKIIARTEAESSLKNSNNTSNHNQWVMVKEIEKELDDAFATIEGVEAYSDGPSVVLNHGSDDQNEDARDQPSIKKKNVRRWKRVARESFPKRQV
ncbi:hypothetical protein EZV62_001767 [Acer yangbiense]|uniref:Uncharacterized protein n=1 Tax=Acer yangbiense TaxID=1000413 RepID=A0A5C7IVT5_9ROSI|nr:hypothetical protein EZV62_001767 [Acer yangbiense]